MFLRRPSWDQLRKAGLRLIPEEFIAIRRPLIHQFSEIPIGSVLPASIPRHRLHQFYNMRRIEALPRQNSNMISASASVPPRPPSAASFAGPLSIPSVTIPVGIEGGGAAQELGSGYQPKMRGLLRGSNKKGKSNG